MWNPSIVKDIKAAFVGTGYKLEFGDNYLNVARHDGVHCEFYPNCVDSDSCVLSATYNLSGVDTDIGCDIPSNCLEFVNLVKEILEAEPLQKEETFSCKKHNTIYNLH
jgi:hypothetical protein